MSSFMLRRRLFVLVWLLPVCANAIGSRRSHAAEPPMGTDFFEQHIRPVLVAHCYECHSANADELRAGLRLDSSAGWLRGGDSGPAVVPQQPDESLLFKAIAYDESVSPMPPDQKLPDATVARFREWIERGAASPQDEVVKQAVRSAESSEKKSTDHWAFQPPKRATRCLELPDDWSRRNRVDELIQSHLVVEGLRPAKSANRATLIRRLYFDLIGLPPSYDEVQRFQQDTSPSAYEEVVEQLLASPRFGERWARFWLDVARFSDTKGYVFTEDRAYPEAFKYRSWVIRAFNQDRPYGDFIKAQLAADQLTPGDAEELPAMGYLTLGRRFLNNQHDIIDDRIDVTTRGLMGLTVTCARCHDHKYDPIPSADYYSLYGVFASSHEPGGAPWPMRLEDREQLVEPVVFLRGQPGRRGPQVPRQFLEVLTGDAREPFRQGSGRLEMAEAIADASNPLTARVFVNRVWGRLFGSYLVDTPSDFGLRCPQPPLADLLDELSVDFLAHDQSLKSLVRQLVSSSTYRQSALAEAGDLEQDPANQWYARMNRRRLDFEGMRDAILHVSGQLDAAQIGGPSVEIAGDTPAARRTLYAHIDRQNFPGLFRIFDVASPDTHAPKRFETTVPQQALYLMNNGFVQGAADALAQRIAAQNDQMRAAVVSLYRIALSRDPDDDEVQLAIGFLTEGLKDSPSDVNSAWSQLAQVLMMSNEFSFLD